MVSKTTRKRSRVVATRLFRTRSGAEVTATIYEPVMVGPDEWKCAFKVTGLDRDVQADAHGVDSLQALTVCVHGLRRQLGKAGHDLLWLDGEPGDLGIPASIPLGYGPKVEEHLTNLLNDEVARLAREKWNKGKP